MSRLLLLFYSANVLVLAVLLARLVERRWPIEQYTHAAVVSDWKVTGINMVLAWLLEPLALMCAVAIVNHAGGGLIHFRTDGAWYFVTLACFVVAFDLYKYWLHRMQHAVPILWAMHSFHHSADALTFVTGGRHYWLERTLGSALLPIFPVLFHVPADMSVSLAASVFLPEVCSHMNLRFPMGCALTWFNSPQWHRIHHSKLPEHLNKNFAGLLPLWDILFKTAWIPEPGEYPPTGLAPTEKVSLLESVIWPFRHYARVRR
jgi:sterol desaturase/sphingolipid hydroxylase (fatty acid hydroxylase superfamily)